MNEYSEKKNIFYIIFGILAFLVLVVLYLFARSLLPTQTDQSTDNTSEQTQPVSDPLVTIVPDDYLKANDSPEVTVNDPKRGPDTAPVKLVIFSDYQCTFCKEAESLLDQAEAEFGDNVQIVWKDAPNPSVYPESANAAEAARCAQQQNTFWEYHKLLFQNQAELGNTLYNDIAKGLKLDMGAFKTCMESGLAEALVQKTYIEGKALGITGTPDFYINETEIPGLPLYEELQLVIQNKLDTFETTQ